MVSHHWLQFYKVVHDSVFVRGSIDALVKVKNLRKRMEKFNEAVNGLKESKQEMSKQVEELAASTDALMAKLKVRFGLEYSPRSTKPPFISSSLQRTLMLCGVALFKALSCIRWPYIIQQVCVFSMSWWRPFELSANLECFSFWEKVECFTTGCCFAVSKPLSAFMVGIHNWFWI